MNPGARRESETLDRCQAMVVSYRSWVLVHCASSLKDRANLIPIALSGSAPE
jgi:hypothetical protein